jgi:tetratricopeptide (TPR) repeat protein
VLGQLTVRDFGSDSGHYYLQRAGWSRLRGELTLARVYSDSALRALEAQLHRHPESAWSRSWLGLAYAGLGRKEDAMREARGAVELMPLSKDATDSPEAYLGLALVAVLVGDHETAIDELELLLSVPTLRSLRDVQITLETYPPLAWAVENFSITSGKDRQQLEDTRAAAYLGSKTWAAWAFNAAVRLVERLRAEGGLMPIRPAEASRPLFDHPQLLPNPFDESPP